MQRAQLELQGVSQWEEKYIKVDGPIQELSLQKENDLLYIIIYQISGYVNARKDNFIIIFINYFQKPLFSL